MKHQTLAELTRIADVRPDEPTAPVLSRQQRLGRWAELLDRDPRRPLATLHGTEYEPEPIRDRMRDSQSPIAVAFDDPLLRRAGLGGDTYGHARQFFALTDWQLHEVVCHCHAGANISSGSAARRVRSAMSGAAPGRILTLLRGIFGA